MPRLKLTKTAVDRLRSPDPSGKQTIYWDTEHKGFGVLVSGTKGTKTYIVQRDLPGGRARRVTVAQTNVLSFDEALTQAKDKLADFYRGIDPKHRAKVGTLRQVLEAYLRAKHAATDADFAAGVNNLRKPTVRAYRSAVERYLAAWANRPLADITHHDVEERHEALATEAGTATANSVMRTLVCFGIGPQRTIPTFHKTRSASEAAGIPSRAGKPSCQRTSCRPSIRPCGGCRTR